MKKLQLIYLLTFLLFVNSLLAQESLLDVGDQAPELMPLKWIKGAPVKSWTPNQLYLVEFGATWCKPCAAAIPELASIQKKYAHQLTVISMFVMERNDGKQIGEWPAYVSNVESYLTKKSNTINYTTGVDDPAGTLRRTWLTAAGLTGIPHIFIIDGNGIIRWMGIDPRKAEQILPSLIETADQKGIALQPVKHTKYDAAKLLLIENNGGNETDFSFRSILVPYDGKIYGLSADHIFNFYNFKPDSIFDKYEDHLELIGKPLEVLYYMAYADTLSNTVPIRHKRAYPDSVKMPHTKRSYGKYWYEPLIEVKDISPFEFNWDYTKNRFNYSLKVPKGRGTARFLQQTLQRDLQTYFGYTAEVQTRQMPYWKVSAPDKSLAQSKLKSPDQSSVLEILDTDAPFIFKNVDMRDVITMLGATYGYGSLDFGKLPKTEQAPFIDETGITEKIDFVFNRDWSFDECRQYLKKMGLELSKAYRNMKVVVIKDSPN